MTEVDGTADAVTLLVTGVGGMIIVTPIARPFLQDDDNASGPVVHLSPTRALTAGIWPDGKVGTDDHPVYLPDDRRWSLDSL